MKTYTQQEILKIAANMERYGGSFFSCLGAALFRADAENTLKLQSLFAEDFERYLRM